ncbi:MAG: hypothetical protein ACXAC5_18640 [Promethearchaeota archaeon]
MIRISEKEIQQKNRFIGTVVGLILLIIGLTILVVGVYFLFFTSIIGDALQLSVYNLRSSLMVMLGNYISLLGLHLLFKKLNTSIKAYMLIAVGLIIMIFSISGYIQAGISPEYRGVWGFVVLVLYGLGHIIFAVYLLTYYGYRKNLVYANIVLIMIVLLLIILLV